jgi:hypothetical protein
VLEACATLTSAVMRNKDIAVALAKNKDTELWQRHRQRDTWISEPWCLTAWLSTTELFRSIWPFSSNQIHVPKRCHPVQRTYLINLSNQSIWVYLICPICLFVCLSWFICVSVSILSTCTYFFFSRTHILRSETSKLHFLRFISIWQPDRIHRLPKQKVGQLHWHCLALLGMFSAGKCL